MNVRNPWLVHYHRSSESHALNLICFPHAGGGPSLFHPWADKMEKHIDLYGVLLPGREARFREAPCRNIEDLIDRLMVALAPEMARPFALFGHSFGSILAFEIARRAPARGYPLKALFVSGRRAPHLANRRTMLHKLEPSDLMKAIGRLEGTPQEILQNPGMMAHFLPSLKADLEVNETYSPLTGSMLTCPVYAFMGREDTEVNIAELLAWRELTSGPFEHAVFAGGHFYLKAETETERLLGLIAQKLRSALFEKNTENGHQG